MRPALLAACLAGVLPAQKGDRPGEEQPPPPDDLIIPDAPALTPEEGLASLSIQPGYRVEIAAADPHIDDPVLLRFDARGRMWVVEMKGFMPDVDGTGETEPVGSIAVLEDPDGDGRYDRRTTWLDGLVLPRGLFLFEDGALVIEPPALWFWRDSDGDGRADRREQVDDGFACGFQQVEHCGNGLIQGMDNWLHLAKHGSRYRRTRSGWREEPSPFVGQWGLCRDDEGRLMYDYNSQYLFGDLYPARYAERNGNLGRQRGVNVSFDRDQSVWPIRVTPGINRGYQKGMLRDGRLARFTAACSPHLYRGERMAGLRGSVFVCEPSGNLVRRAVLDDRGTSIRADNAYERAEFLASTDERFRPVDVTTGPDGALYVVDMYRGIIQHRQYVTTFLRRQILERGLDTPVGLGRVYRIVPEEGMERGFPDLAARQGPDLVAALRHGNGPVRDTAQRLLVERCEGAALAPLRSLARDEGAGAIPRLHALWTLEGTGWLDRADVLAALRSPAAPVRRAGMQLAEVHVARGDLLVLAVMERRIAAARGRERWQLAHSLGAGDGDEARRLLADVALEGTDDPVLRDAVVGGLEGHEVPFLERLIGRVLEDGTGTAALLKSLAHCVGRERRGERVAAVLELAAGAPGWQQQVLLQGLVDAIPRGRRPDGHYRLPGPPPGWAVLMGGAARADAERLWPALAWGEEAAPPEAEWTEAERARFAAGREVYARHCAACHQRDGGGMTGLAPPLSGSEWVQGDPATAIKVVLCGLSGPIEVAGRGWDLAMEPQAALSDEDIARVLTYVRRAWDNAAGAVTAEQVGAVRAAVSGRSEPFRAGELR